MKYTKGKWETVFGEDRGNGEFVVYQGDTGTICRGDNEMIDWKANARLISAAPELYEALNNLVELATKQLDQSATNEGMENCDCLASARAALAKAEGR